MSTGILVAMWLAGVNALLLAGTGLIFLVGLLDDFLHLKPYVRIVFEIAAAGLALSGGIDGINPVSVAGGVALIWIVLVSNAVNLIDGADGVASSVVGAVTFIGGLFLASVGDFYMATLLWSLTAVCVGFLVFNWPPASIFMGDSGSLVLGYLLAVFALEVGYIAGPSFPGLPYVVAFSFVAVPFLDASFVAMIRILVGQNPAKGGTHHIHHRIRLAGFSAPQTASILGVLAGVIASSIFLATLQPALFVTLLPFGLVSLLLFEVLLVHHTGFLPSKSGETVERKYLQRLGRWARRVSPFPKVFADVSTVIAAALLAAVLTHSGPLSAVSVVQMLVVFAIIKLVTMWAFGLYKQQWLTSTGTPELLRTLASIMAASVLLAVIATFISTWNVGSRLILVDFMAASIGLIGLRIGYRAFRSVLGIQQRKGTRVLLYGAGVGGEFAVREMRLNESHSMNPMKHGARNYGLKVWGGFQHLTEAIRKTNAEQVVITTVKIPNDRALVICRACRELDIPCSRMSFSFSEQLSSGQPVEEELALAEL